MNLIEKDEILAEVAYCFDTLNKTIKSTPAIHLSDNEKKLVWTCPSCGNNVFDPVRLGYEYCPFCGLRQNFISQINKMLVEEQNNELHEDSPV